jgi:hypothetical protein
MTLENMQQDETYAVVTGSNKIAYTSNDEELAKKHRDRLNKAWRVVKIVTSFEEIH